MISDKAVRTIGVIIIIVAVAAIVLSMCGSNKFSGTWDINDGEVQIEFLNDKQCVMSDDLIDGYDGVYEYEVMDKNKIVFSAYRETVIMTYEITDKANKKMNMDEYVR